MLGLVRHHPALIIIIFVLLLRAPYLGDPHIHIDESYYLLFAERWHHGAIPYVDIWDRKPIGLFLIFRLAMIPGGVEAAIIGYQLLAIACVIATALLLAAMARSAAGARAGLAAGLLYPAGLLAMQGSGGQATIFTNLATALAAWLIFTTWRDRGASAWRLGLAMLILGAALQVKYTAAFEAVPHGLAALAVLYRRGWPLLQIAGAALGMMLLGLLPSAAALAGFAAAGQLAPFLDANFGTSFAKIAASQDDPMLSVLVLLPIVALGLVRARPWPDTLQWWLIGWALAGLAAAFMLGLASEHRLQPLLPPLILLAAARDGWRRWQLALAIAVMMAVGIVAKLIDIRGEGSPATSYRIAAAIRAVPGDGCIYVADTLPLLYALARTCTPTPYAFPTLLTHPDEINSIGIDARAELARVLASRPRAIVITRPRKNYMDPAARGLIEAELAAHYRLAQVFPFASGEYQLFVVRQPSP